MKLHFNELFTTVDDLIFPREDVVSSGVLHKKGEGFPDLTTLYGVAYSALKSYNFEVNVAPGESYEIKGYYVQ